MTRKSLYNVGTIAIVFTLGIFGWFLLKPRDMDPVVIYKTVKTHPRTTENMQSAERGSTTVPQSALEDSEDNNQDKYRREIDKAKETPAYLEYKEKQAKNLPGFNITLWWDFLESQGIKHSGRQVQEASFREHFPTGEYQDYEPMMRRRLAELFLVADLPREPSEISAVRLDTVNILSQFRSDDPATRIWMRGYFNGYDGDIAWANEIRNNAERILGESTTADLDTVSVSENSMSSTTDATEVPIDTQSPKDESIHLSGDFEQVPQTLEALEKQLTEQTLLHPGLPTEADLQKTLSERFSPQRFNSAVRALKQYGSEEGLRRLQKSDPEVATYLETFLQRNKENK